MFLILFRKASLSEVKIIKRYIPIIEIIIKAVFGNFIFCLALLTNDYVNTNSIMTIFDKSIQKKSIFK